jgi:putative ABC transport system substrate-binding protein
MRRREFITLLGGAAAAWPLAARAQQGGKLPLIGFLGADPGGWSAYTAAFVERLHQLGWIEGRNIAIDYRWSEGRSERDAEIAAEFVRLKVDVVVTSGLGALALKQVTSVIPIVFAVAADPISMGLVESLSRPGGNITGMSGIDTTGKRLQILREAVPNLRRLAVLGNFGNPGVALEQDEVQAAARTLGLEVVPLQIRRAEDIATAFDALAARADALDVLADPLASANRTRIVTFALAARLPTIFGNRDYVQAGGLLSYGANIPTQFRRSAELVDKILRGTKPGDIPVEQPTKFDLVINLTTAKAIGLTMPPLLLARADEVIE